MTPATSGLNKHRARAAGCARAAAGRLLGSRTSRSSRRCGTWNAARELAPVVRAFAAHPAQVVRSLPDEWRQRMGKASVAEADFDDDWNEHLHNLLGAPWPCPEAQQLSDLLADIGQLLTEKGLGTGRHTYGWYSDMDSDLCTATWCAVRHSKPEVVLETGVAHGVSSRVVLEALVLNDRGHLWTSTSRIRSTSRCAGRRGRP